MTQRRRAVRRRRPSDGTKMQLLQVLTTAVKRTSTETTERTGDIGV